MWLPKDERRLLYYYHLSRDQVGKESRFSLTDLVEVLYCSNVGEVRLHRQIKAEPKTLDNLDQNVEQYLQELNRIGSVNQALRQRGLIDIKSAGSDFVTLALTVKGDDLGRLYSSKLGTAWLWCVEFKFCVIIGTIIGLAMLVLRIWAALKN